MKHSYTNSIIQSKKIMYCESNCMRALTDAIRNQDSGNLWTVVTPKERERLERGVGLGLSGGCSLCASSWSASDSKNVLPFTNHRAVCLGCAHSFAGISYFNLEKGEANFTLHPKGIKKKAQGSQMVSFPALSSG